MLKIEPRAGLRRMAVQVRMHASSIRAEALAAMEQAEICANLMEKEADLMEEKSRTLEQATVAAMCKAYLEHCPELRQCVITLGYS